MLVAKVHNREFFMKSIKIILTCFFLLISSSSLAATFAVDSTADSIDGNTADNLCDDGSGNCTLRAAIQQANATAGADAITIPDGTYTITMALPDISTEMTMTGNASSPSSVDITKASSPTIRIFNVTSSGTFTLTGVRISGGNEDTGSGLQNAGTTIIQDSIITGNTATIGAGIYISGGSLTLTRSTILSNTVTASGGGIYLSAGNLTINRSSIVSNSTTGGSGSGGGGMYLAGGTTVSIFNTTFYNNETEGNGGGFCNISTATINIENTTFCENNADEQGGGLYTTASTNMSFKNNLFADNSATTASPDCKYGTLAVKGPSEGYNLLSDSSGCNMDEQTTDITGVAARMDTAVSSPATAGGTYCPMTSSSRAVNNGPETCADDDGDATDQLEQSRVGNCDIGAFEFQGTATPVGTDTDTDGDGIPDDEDDDDDGDGIPDDEEDDDSSTSSSSGCALMGQRSEVESQRSRSVEKNSSLFVYSSLILFFIYLLQRRKLTADSF